MGDPQNPLNGLLGKVGQSPLSGSCHCLYNLREAPCGLVSFRGFLGLWSSFTSRVFKDTPLGRNASIWKTFRSSSAELRAKQDLCLLSTCWRFSPRCIKRKTPMCTGSGWKWPCTPLGNVLSARAWSPLQCHQPPYPLFNPNCRHSTGSRGGNWKGQ